MLLHQIGEHRSLGLLYVLLLQHLPPGPQQDGSRVLLHHLPVIVQPQGFTLKNAPLVEAKWEIQTKITGFSQGSGKPNLGVGLFRHAL